jgi:hypothetical protein
MKAKFKFEKGERVKAFFKAGGPHAKQHAEWHLATYVGKTAKTGYKVSDKSYATNYKVSYHGKTFTTNRVMKWEPLSDEDLQKHVGEHFEELYELTVKAVSALLPSVYKVKRSGSEDYTVVKRSDSEDYTVEIGENNLTISPVSIEITTLNSFKEVPGWAVTTWGYYPGSRLDPPDYVDSEIGTERRVDRAVALAIRTAWEQDSEDFWQGVLADKMMQEEGELLP